jgi:hypothetical protein
VPIKEDSLKELRNALEKAKKDGFEIELLTAVTPPAGRPPNITGVIEKNSHFHAHQGMGFFFALDYNRY